MQQNRAEQGRALRARRERLGITRVALAARCGRSLAGIANLETGYVPRHSVVLAEVTAALDAIETAL